MEIIEITKRTPSLIEQLVVVWEKSIKATHLFLSAGEVEEIKKYVPQALNRIAHLIIARDESSRPVAFMGIECIVSLIFNISVTSIMKRQMKLSDKGISAFLWHLLFGNATVF